jgi:tryptophanyl-tRNA synthetase
MRPTGRLHLGNWAGVLENWVHLQEEYENFHLVADWHALTTEAHNTADLGENTQQMVIDWLAGGIDPDKSPIFIQSHIPGHAELHLIFSMLVTVPRLERNPAVKEQARALNLEDKMAYGHLGYPVLQAADILLYKGNLVPVGEDQVPHLEIAREIARRFNKLYAPVFPEPEAQLNKYSRLPGTDGQRMSKSLNNTILISDTPEDLAFKLRKCITDPQKVRKGDPGRPEVCPIFTYWQKFAPERCAEVDAGCRSGELGCVQDKKDLTQKMTECLQPFRDKRAYYESHPGEVTDIIAEGDRRANAVAQQTMSEVREAMKLP